MKKEYAEEVAARIIEQLEQSTAPWQKPWQPGELRLPYNPTTGKEYRGMNSLWLHMQGHSDPRWITYNQAAAEGAQVRNGSKGTHIVYWKFSEERKATDEQGRPVIDPDTGKQKTVTVQLERPRSFMAVVFNGSQIDGFSRLEVRPTGPEPERHARAEAILANSGAVIRHDPCDRAFYRSSKDSITLPERNQFPTADNYYATALHELGHWTGHPSRLDRDLAHPFGSEGYAREELRAEIASLMLGQRLEIGHDPGQHAAYVGLWVEALKKDPKEIFRAASDAERISGYVMDFEREQELSQVVEADLGPSWTLKHRDIFAAGLSAGQADVQQSVPEQHSYTVQSRRIVPEYAANHAGQNAVYVQLDDGRRAWGFDATDEAAEQSAVERAQRVGLDADRAPTRAVLHEQPEKPMQSRTYLAVPYAEKNEAKALGAKWDKEAKSWYAPEGVDVATSGLARWSVDKANVVTASELKPAIEQFKDALKDTGLQLKGEVITDGKMQRVPVEGDRGGATSGAYAYHEAGRTPGGFIQNYKTGEVVHWKPEGKTQELSAADRARQAAEATEQRKARDATRQSEHGTTAAAAQALWNESPDATADNAYCKAKGIANPVGLRVVPDSVSPETVAHGIKIAKTAKEAKVLREADPANRVFKAGDLLIPGSDGEGKLWTLQSVNPYFKSFMKGGRKAGLYTVTGADDPRKALAQDGDSPLVLAEGYATADTVSRLLGGKPVIVAFDSGNLDSVATELRERHPSRVLLIAADNDHNALKEQDLSGKPKINVGLVKAAETAKKHGGGVMAPQFKEDEKGSDWNDLAESRGDEAARRMLAEQMAVAKRDAAITAERLTTIARIRDMEARNDPTISADDLDVTIERGHAVEVLAGAQSALSDVRSMAADGMTGNTKGAKRSVAAVKAGIDHKTEAMRDRANEEREELLNHGQTGPLGGVTAGGTWKKLSEQAKQALIEDVKNGKDVSLPKDAPAKLKQMAGLESTPLPRSRSRGIDAFF